MKLKNLTTKKGVSAVIMMTNSLKLFPFMD